MNTEELILESYAGNKKALQNLKNTMQDLTRIEQEYSQKGEKPVPREVAQKLGIRMEEYFDLKKILESGEYDTLMREPIQEDFDNGAEFINPGMNW